ncbi:MAG: hypothetical protein KJZ47_09180, partial [Gemmatimonadales bacterium]|nr:hypothetical protein [Gemmatimonadales bacterium]
MRSVSPWLVVLALVTAPRDLAAQGTAEPDTTTVTCPTDLSPSGLKVCTAALDGILVMHPIAALLMNGGNPRLGSARVIGRFGHFALAMRTTTAMAVMPDLSWAGQTDTVPASWRVQLYAPKVDLAMGLFQKEMPMGVVGVDVLLGLLLIPPNRTAALVPVPGNRTIGNAAFSLDWGIRAGMESPTLPTVSLSVMKRSSPTVRVGGTTDGRTTAWTFNASSINAR